MSDDLVKRTKKSAVVTALKEQRNESYHAGQEAMREAAEAWVATHYPDLPNLQDEIRSLSIKDAPDE